MSMHNGVNLADRQKIRDEYLRDSTVTIVIVGTETKNRKHVDWEIYSSMYDGTVNKKSGILVISLSNVLVWATHDEEKETVYPEITNWITIDDRSEFEKRYPDLPDRIIDNLVAKAKISVTYWNKIKDSPDLLTFLIEAAHKDRMICEYDLSSPMRRANA